MIIFNSFYAKVLLGLVAGIVLGMMRPDYAVEMKILGDSFIALLKMLIGPIIFTTVVLGISHPEVRPFFILKLFRTLRLR